MLTASFALTALAITVVTGGALTAWLWWVRCRQLVVAGGIRALAAMRWREFSRFVIEALHAQGFEASRAGLGAQHAPPSDLRLTRNGETWLLACKQGAGSRIDAATVAELAKTVRITSASGGILATLGRIESAARKHSHGIELLDGATLWPLIEPLLPPSLHSDLTASARAQTRRAIGLAWLAAVAFGIAAAMLLTPWLEADPSPTTATAPAATRPARPADLPAAPSEPDAAAPTPLSEEQQREAVIDAVSALPGIERASWVTRSTLLVNLRDEASERLLAGICAALVQHDRLRASRVQLQPPESSEAPVRFTQCRLY